MIEIKEFQILKKHKTKALIFCREYFRFSGLKSRCTYNHCRVGWDLNSTVMQSKINVLLRISEQYRDREKGNIPCRILQDLVLWKITTELPIPDACRAPLYTWQSKVNFSVSFCTRLSLCFSSPRIIVFCGKEWGCEKVCYSSWSKVHIAFKLPDISLAAFCPRATFLHAMITFAPLQAKSFTTSRPIPAEPPRWQRQQQL